MKIPLALVACVDVDVEADAERLDTEHLMTDDGDRLLQRAIDAVRDNQQYMQILDAMTVASLRMRAHGIASRILPIMVYHGAYCLIAINEGVDA